MKHLKILLVLALILAPIQPLTSTCHAALSSTWRRSVTRNIYTTENLLTDAPAGVYSLAPVLYLDGRTYQPAIIQVDRNGNLFAYDANNGNPRWVSWSIWPHKDDYVGAYWVPQVSQ